jgi:hypothetical protein
MDFADATLVHLATRESLSTIFAVYHADFEAYGIEGRRRFACCPSSGRKFPALMTNPREDCRLG